MNKNMKIDNNNFSIIFKEIENYNKTDSSLQDNFVSEDELVLHESIRVFGEICKDLNISEANSTNFLTFS